MRIVLNFRDGVMTFTSRNVSIEKKMRPDELLIVAHKLYHKHWIMYQEYRKDADGSDVLDRVVLFKPRD